MTTDDKHGFIQNLANGAWKLDPSRRPLVLGEWKHSIRSYEIDSLRQSHDTVDPTFGHGPHEGNSVAELTDKLIVGECQPAELTKEFAHRCASRTITRIEALQGRNTAVQRQHGDAYGTHCAGTLRALQVARAAVSATRFLILF